MFGFAMSGLQEFLYDLSPETQARGQRAAEGGRDRDAARRLRIRSTMLTLVPGLVAWELVKPDTPSEIVYLGGGKLLAKANPTAIAGLEPKLDALYSWLSLRSSGKLGAYWATCQEESSLAESLTNLLAKLHLAKWRTGRSNGAWHSSSGQISTAATAGSLGDRDWESRHGAEFARREDWTGFHVGDAGWEIGPWRVSPATGSPAIAVAGRADALVEVSVPTYTPKRGNETVLLHELAETDAEDQPRSGPYLALLKLDGDGIGALISGALNHDRTGGTFRKLSADLARFFGPELAEFLKIKYPRIYLVYSGGDDLVATGYFMDVLAAARDIHDRFADTNIGATVSAGVTFYDRQSSILRAIEAAETELENAKDNDGHGPGHKRNAVSISGCRLGWKDLQRTLTDVHGLKEAIENEALNRGALNLLRQLGESWLPSAPEAERELRFRTIPQLAYMRSRRTGWQESQWPPAVKDLFDSLQNDEKDWPRASLVGTLAAWCTKRLTEEE